MPDDQWLSTLQNLHDQDKASREVSDAVEKAPNPADHAALLLRQCRTHELLRQVQKIMLNGGGVLKIYDKTNEYDEAIVLMWKGPISAAQKPKSLKDVEHFISVGANGKGVWVNDALLSEPTAEALKTAILTVCKQLPTKANRK
ncbi:MAG: hypothetical protein KC419_14810 [Anaerolineales bacterium]|nr:hypothetical protein [Anaerolineales bacterium]